MAAVNASEKNLMAENVKTEGERIATLEERSQHAATKAELHRALLWLYVALLTTICGLLGGLIIHLNNATQAEIVELRQLLIELIQRSAGG